MKDWTQTAEIPERNYATELSRERVELVAKYHRIAYGTATVLMLLFAASAARLWQQHRQAVRDALAVETERKARQDSEQEYRSLFDNAIEGIFQTTPDGRIITANRALARMYGYDSPQQLMETVTDVAAQLYVEPGQRQALLDALRVSEVVSNFEFEVMRADGRLIWVRENVRAIRDDRGETEISRGERSRMFPMSGGASSGGACNMHWRRCLETRRRAR